MSVMTDTAVVHAWISVATSAYMLLFTLANVAWLEYASRLRKPPVFGENAPKVSVLVPARNEARRIGPAIEALMRQDYPDYEVIVLDDNSTDGTSDIVRSLAGTDGRIRCEPGKSLPEGWKGKPYAMQQLVSLASGEILLFLDADMCPDETLVSWTAGHMVNSGVDFLSGYARHTASSRKEFLLFPVMYLATSFLLPLWAFGFTRSYMFSHAIGQYFCVRRSVMDDVGGFTPVRNRINEDIQMARHLKGLGYRQLFLDAKDRIRGNMYDSMEHARMGIMRVVYEYFDNLVYPFVLMGMVMAVFLLLPIPLAVIAAANAAPAALPLALSILLMLAAWWITMKDRGLPGYVALFYPIHFGWVMILAFRSIILSRRGRGYVWKGRTVR